ncbi:hypothetical protein PIROE2DRAFT_3826 [Piromyces sp. E2]|nr:hypothetical protein PIROE2DRAFT_3826 [Piromyces sp. E2]|eukprot:OUM68526.1 hypothetical protein PIROE2DRAFT_3826 [Piromyces sp. E2]
MHIFKKIYGIPKYEKKSLTIPHSPNLTKKRRKYSIQTNNEDFIEFRKKIQRENDESNRLRQFIAQPIPNKVKRKNINPYVPVPIPLVQPIPFNLITEKRGIQYQQEFQDNIKKKQQEEDNLRKFVAKPPLILYKIPFTISKSDKPLTEFDEIKFATEKRSKEWIKFENRLKEKEKQIEKLKKEQDEYKKVYEEQWIKEQRKKTIIYANPIPSYLFNK